MMAFDISSTTIEFVADLPVEDVIASAFAGFARIP